MKWIDHLRIACALAVVEWHVSAEYQGLLPGGETWTLSFAEAANLMVRWAVPCFVMISGCLLLQPGKDLSVWGFYRKRISRILIPSVFWTVFYLGLMLGRFLSRHEEIPVPAIALLCLEGKPAVHLWFLYMLAGLYLIAPFLRHVVKVESRSGVILLTGLLLTLAMLGDLWDRLRGPKPVLFLLLFVPWVGYFMLGHVLGNAVVKLPARWLFFFFATGAFLTLFGARVLPEGNQPLRNYFHSTLAPSVILMSVAVFAFFMRAESTLPSNSFVSELTACTLGVYLVHPFVMSLLKAVGFGAKQFGPELGIPLLTFVVFLLSVVAAWVFRRIPGLRRAV